MSEDDLMRCLTCVYPHPEREDDECHWLVIAENDETTYFECSECGAALEYPTTEVLLWAGAR